MKVKNIIISSIASIVILGGCTGKYDPSPKAIDLNATMQAMTASADIKISGKKGETLKDVLAAVQAKISNGVMIIDKTESNITIQGDFSDFSMDDLRQYIKVVNNKNIVLRKFNDKLFTVEEYVDTKIAENLKKEEEKKSFYVIPDIDIKINGEFTYAELFDTLREKKINIITEIRNNNGSTQSVQASGSTTSGSTTNSNNDSEVFNLNKKAPIFFGSLPNFLNMVAAKERLFVVTTKDGIKLKDVETVTYNLRLPRVDMSSGFASTSSNGMNNTMGGMNNTMGGMNNTMSGMNNTMGGMNNTMGGMNNTMNGMNNTMGGINNTMSGMNNTIGGMNNTMGGMNNTMGGMNNTMGGINNTIGRGSSSGSTGAAPIDAIANQMTQMLGNNAIFSVNASSGTISITGNYDSIDIANKLIGDFHDIYDKSIKLEVHVYEVALDSKNAFGIDYSFLKSELLGDKISSVLNLTTNLNSGLTLLPSVTGSFTNNTGSLTTGATDTTVGTVSPKQTEGIIFKNLNKFGKASVVTKPTLGTINNIPVKLSIMKTVDYIPKISQQLTFISGGTSGAGGTSTITNPEPVPIETGYTLNLHPRIEGDFIKIAMKNEERTLNALNPYVYKTADSLGNPIENTVYLKDVSTRIFDETVKIKEGETAIIGGYMYEKKISMKNGMPLTDGADSKNDYLTSAKETATEKVEIVITISATII